jgi:hypothetical protein
LPHGWHR